MIDNPTFRIVIWIGNSVSDIFEFNRNAIKRNWNGHIMKAFLQHVEDHGHAKVHLEMEIKGEQHELTM